MDQALAATQRLATLRNQMLRDHCSDEDQHVRLALLGDFHSAAVAAGVIRLDSMHHEYLSLEDVMQDLQRMQRHPDVSKQNASKIARTLRVLFFLFPGKASPALQLKEGHADEIDHLTDDIQGILIERQRREAECLFLLDRVGGQSISLSWPSGWWVKEHCVPPPSLAKRSISMVGSFHFEKVPSAVVPAKGEALEMLTDFHSPRGEAPVVQDLVVAPDIQDAVDPGRSRPDDVQDLVVAPVVQDVVDPLAMADVQDVVEQQPMQDV